MNLPKPGPSTRAGAGVAERDLVAVRRGLGAEVGEPGDRVAAEVGVDVGERAAERRLHLGAVRHLGRRPRRRLLPVVGRSRRGRAGGPALQLAGPRRLAGGHAVTAIDAAQHPLSTPVAMLLAHARSTPPAAAASPTCCVRSARPVHGGGRRRGRGRAVVSRCGSAAPGRWSRRSTRRGTGACRRSGRRSGRCSRRRRCW